MTEAEMRSLIGKRFRGRKRRNTSIWVITAVNESGAIEIMSENNGNRSHRLFRGAHMLDYIIESIDGEWLEPLEPVEISYLPRTIGLMWLDVENGEDTMTMKGKFDNGIPGKVAGVAR